MTRLVAGILTTSPLTDTFLHLLTDSDSMKFLQSIKKHMHENTLFYIDIFVPNPLFLYRNKKRIKNLEYIDSKTNQTIYWSKSKRNPKRRK